MLESVQNLSLVSKISKIFQNIFPFSPSPRTRLEDFDDCGEKGSATRVIGGTEVPEKYNAWGLL